MKKVLGFILIIIGIVIGLYAGLWWAFVGGIVQIINEIRADDLNALTVALGVVKMVFAGFIGWVVGFIAIIPGFILLKD